jgi:hypothetical protein
MSRRQSSETRRVTTAGGLRPALADVHIPLVSQCRGPTRLRADPPAAVAPRPRTSGRELLDQPSQVVQVPTVGAPKHPPRLGVQYRLPVFERARPPAKTALASHVSFHLGFPKVISYSTNRGLPSSVCGVTRTGRLTLQRVSTASDYPDATPLATTRRGAAFAVPLAPEWRVVAVSMTSPSRAALQPT